jgi:hypothetical protein
MKILTLIIGLNILAQGVRAKEESETLRLLISEYSEIKKDYLLNKKGFIESGSQVENFGKVKWTIPEIAKKTEKHINKILVAQLAPSMSWNPEEDLGRLDFGSIELCKHEEFFYWKLHFWLHQPIGGGAFSIFVACYLDGEIAQITDHESEEKE